MSPARNARRHAYDYAAYIGFALEVLRLRIGEQLDPLAAGLRDPNLISTADLYNRIAQEP